MLKVFFIVVSAAVLMAVEAQYDYNEAAQYYEADAVEQQYYADEYKENADYAVNDYKADAVLQDAGEDEDGDYKSRLVVDGGETNIGGEFS